MSIYFDGRSQRWVVEVSRRMRDGKGEVVRVRKRKTMPKGASQAQAQAVSERMDAAEVTRALSVEGADGWEAYVEGLRTDPRSWLYVAIQKCRHRAKAGGYVFGLTIDVLVGLMLRSKGRCEVTGLRFTTAGCEGSRRRPFFHSIDKIDAAGGYVAGNIRLVCYGVNVAMLNWGEDVFAELARGYVFNRYSAINLMHHASGEVFPVSKTTMRKTSVSG